MVYVLYKQNDNDILFTGVYENENDAIEIKNLYNDDSFKIVCLPIWKITLNKEKIVYNEEDNNINESDLEITHQVRKRRRIYNEELIIDANSDNNNMIKYDDNIHTYIIIFSIIVLFFILYSIN